MKIFNLKNFTTYSLVVTMLVANVFFSISFATENANNSKYTVVRGVNADLADYVAQTRRKIKNNWYPPVAEFENAATIVLTINKDGTLEDCRLSAPSPSQGFNDSLINAAKKTKYSPLPDSYMKKNIDIDLDFSMQRHTVTK